MDEQSLPQKLLDWYDRERRDLPWRYAPGSLADPYRVWLSEIMLQQTTVATVKGYFIRFISRWPTVNDLAKAELDEVLHAWQGLGYYARARNLHKCAQVVANDLDGTFPDSEDGLIKLPGVGPYTAAAIAAIAFGRHAVVVDGNVERVISRMFQIETPLPDSKAEIKDHAARLTPLNRAGDYAQAVMDLGASLCSPKSPTCSLCPWQSACQAHQKGEPGDYPRKRAKATKPTRYGVVFWARRKDGAILLRRRPEKGLLGGMMEVPSTTWFDQAPVRDKVMREAPISALWSPLKGSVRHTFTHFHLELTVWLGRVSGNPPVDGIWVTPDNFKDYALPTVMKKVVRHALQRIGTKEE